MMKLLFNASNLRFGGGITVAMQLLQSVIPLREKDKIYIIAPAGKGYEVLARFPQVQMIYVPESFHSNWLVKWYYNRFVFRKWAQQYKTDKIISLGNIAFPSGKIPQLLLIQNAYLLHTTGTVWKKMSLGSKLYNRFMIAYTKAHLRYADYFALQTGIMQQKFCAQFHIPKDKTCVIPNVIPSFPQQTEERQPDNTIKLLVLSKYYPHKNLEILLPLAKLIRAGNHPVIISITISPDESAGAAAFAAQVATQQLGDIIQLVGHIQHEDIPAIYQRHDALLLPTMLESFSGSYLEAMYFRKPVFTSDLDFARAVCGDAAFYFDPMQATSILDTILAAFANDTLLQQKIDRGTTIIQSMPSLKQVAADFSEIIDTFGACAE